MSVTSCLIGLSLIIGMAGTPRRVPIPFNPPPSEKSAVAFKLSIRPNVHPAPHDYRLWGTFCVDERPQKLCHAFVSTEPESFTPDGLRDLTSKLERRFRRRSKVKVFLFDNVRWAEAHARYKADLRDLDNHIRGMYYFDRRKCEEYVKFSSGKDKPWDELTIVSKNLRCETQSQRR